MGKSVLIMGGGVAGMSAAHELAERGFAVTVFERHPGLPGGKARSVHVGQDDTGQRKPLPGEHGFRFFPGFYRHITDTMKRIPFQDPGSGRMNPKGVFDNLVECSHIMMARMGQTPILAPGHFPNSLSDLKLIFHDLFHTQSGLEPGESEIIAEKIWQLMTACEERRENVFEHVGWWEFTDAERHSANYRTLFVEGITRTLVAAKAETASTKTGGDIFLQLLFNMAEPLVPADRILCGPTNEVWLHPWLDYLRSKGVQYNFSSEVVEINFDQTQVTGVQVDQAGKGKQTFTADYYICALPVERTARLVSHQMLKLDPCLADIKTLAKSVAWMNGIQFYLSQDVKINRGHIILADSPWALTAISQVQFWKYFDISQYGDGTVKGIISVDVSNWDDPGLLYGKPAKNCTREEVIAEIWEQMKRSFNVNGQTVLNDEDLKLAHVDDDIIFPKDLPAKAVASAEEEGRWMKFGSPVCDHNEEPLLVNRVDTWMLRRESYTDIPNFFLAADYIKTNTDLATMEGANEAARRAVNGIIEASGTKAPFCRIWKLREPDFLLFYKWLDSMRYNKGLPWKYNEPLFGRLMNWLFRMVKKLARK